MHACRSRSAAELARADMSLDHESAMDMSHGDTGTFGGHVIGGTAFMVFGIRVLLKEKMSICALVFE